MLPVVFAVTLVLTVASALHYVYLASVAPGAPASPLTRRRLQLFRTSFEDPAARAPPTLRAEVGMLRVLLMAAVLGVPAGSEPQAGGAGRSKRPVRPRRRAPDVDDRVDDPNYSRLMFAPTGRPLRRATATVSDHELVFPGFAVGLTDNLSLAGGVSVDPGPRPGRAARVRFAALGFEPLRPRRRVRGRAGRRARRDDDSARSASPSAWARSARATTASPSASAWAAS